MYKQHNRLYVTRQEARMLSQEFPVGDPWGGPAAGLKQDAVTQIFESVFDPVLNVVESVLDKPMELLGNVVEGALDNPLRTAALIAGSMYAPTLLAELVPGAASVSAAEFVAADAAQLAAQGLSEAQIASTLTASGVSSEIAAATAAAAASGASANAITSQITSVFGDGALGTINPASGTSNAYNTQIFDDGTSIVTDKTTGQVLSGIDNAGTPFQVVDGAAQYADGTALAHNAVNATANVPTAQAGMSAQDLQTLRAQGISASDVRNWSQNFTPADIRQFGQMNYTPQDINMLENFNLTDKQISQMAYRGVEPDYVKYWVDHGYNANAVENELLTKGNLNDLVTQGPQGEINQSFVPKPTTTIPIAEQPPIAQTPIPPEPAMPPAPTPVAPETGPLFHGPEPTPIVPEPPPAAMPPLEQVTLPPTPPVPTVTTPTVPPIETPVAPVEIPPQELPAGNPPVVPEQPVIAPQELPAGNPPVVPETPVAPTPEMPPQPVTQPTGMEPNPYDIDQTAGTPQAPSLADRLKDAISSGDLSQFTTKELAYGVGAGILAPTVLSMFGNNTAAGTRPGYTVPAWGTVTPLVSPGMNPGYVHYDPYYNTTSPVQAQYYWGAHPVQTQPGQAQVGAIAGAGTTPWGLQHSFFEQPQQFGGIELYGPNMAPIPTTQTTG
jgi:hypothetical protein